MKIEPNMYVRTPYGIKRITEIICGQDVRFDNIDGFDEDLRKYHDYDGIAYNGSCWRELIIGEPSHNITCLIEVEDYVNGSKVIEIEIYNNEKYLYVEKTKYSNANQNDINVYYKKEDINSIVTKEQFESVRYEVEK